MTPFETRSGELDELLADGTRFGTIEDWIEDQPIDGDSKAALWLMAWSESNRARNAERWWRQGQTESGSTPHPQSITTQTASTRRLARTANGPRGLLHWTHLSRLHSSTLRVLYHPGRQQRRKPDN